MNTFRQSTLYLVLLFGLSGCSLAEFFIDRTINRLDKRINSQLNELARFDQVEKAQLSALSLRTANWIRGVRMPILVNDLRQWADEIDQLGYLSQEAWLSTFATIENGFALSQSPPLMREYAAFIYALDLDKRQQIINGLRKAMLKWQEESESEPIEKQNKRIIRGYGFLLKGINTSLNKQQKSDIMAILDQRRSDFEADYQQAQRSLDRLETLFNEPSIQQTEFEKSLSDVWAASELGMNQIDPELWQYNLSVAYRSFDYVLDTLDDDKRMKLSKLMRRYADLFDDLSKKYPFSG